MWSPIFAGVAATFVGIGLQRFAYGPILPALVRDDWLAEGPAGLLGAANLAGYLAGALMAGMLARPLGMVAALRVCMLLAALGLAACAWNGGFWWLLPWRALAGITGGALMVLAGPAVQAVVPADRRGFASGIVITGIGAGIIASAVLVPLALGQGGLSTTWLALAAAAFLLTLLTWRHWPDVPAPAPTGLWRRPPPGAALQLAGYGLAGLAATPHLIFWPDFIARGLGQGVNAGAFWWLVFGVGTFLGGIVLGTLADRWGPVRAIRFGLAVQAVATGLPLVAHGPVALAVSSLAGGITALGLTSLGLVRARAFGPVDGPLVWRLATGLWGAAMAAGGFALTGLLVATSSHLPLFATGLAAALAALVLAFRERVDS